MKKFLAGSVVIFALLVPVLAQWHARLSPDDQSRFDSYYSRWLEYKRTNNRDQIVSMEKRMQDVMAHYRIPSNVPYGQVASNGPDRDMRRDDHRRDGYHDRDRDRDRNQWRLSPDDQRRFDSYYSRWQAYKRTNNRDQIVSMEKRMQDLMAHYRIPSNVPYSRIASH